MLIKKALVTHRGERPDHPIASLDNPQKRPSCINRDYADADILRLSNFFRTNPNPILVFSPDGFLIKANPVATKLLKRLQLQETELLPPDHSQIVQACLSGAMHEYSIEVTAKEHVFALTYHPMTSFKLVYLYVIEITEFRRVEEELLQIVSNTLSLAKQAIFKLKAFRKKMPKSAHQTVTQEPCLEMFVAMDGCVFVSDNRLGEWDPE